MEAKENEIRAVEELIKSDYLKNESKKYKPKSFQKYLIGELSKCTIDLSIAMDALDDYLNAGSKEERRKAAEKAKKVYKDFYGIEFKNRIDR